jgi:hypothetical protein
MTSPLLNFTVTPAKAGVPLGQGVEEMERSGIPAFAGMTKKR